MMLATAEDGITLLRREVKLLVGPEEAAEIAAQLAAYLDRSLPDPTDIVTVYFDAPGLPLAKRARASPADCHKVRMREYLPSVRRGGVVLEVKRERGARSTKSRVWLPRSHVRAALAGGALEGPPLPFADARFEPAAAVYYQRRVYQCEEGWRVTLDGGLAFHAATWELLAADDPPLLLLLGPPAARQEASVLEVKYLGEEPPSCVRALLGRAMPYSKFAEAAFRIHSLPSGGLAGG